MNRPAWLALGLLALTLVFTGWRYWHGRAVPMPQASSAVGAASAPAASAQSSTTLTNKVSAAAPESASSWGATLPEEELPTTEQDWAPSETAVISLREAARHGDPRTPPLAPPAPEREMPTAEELADPDLYLQYEARQQQAVYASFVEAAGREIAELDALIARAEQEGGVTEAQLEEGRRKRDMLIQQRDELLESHPELAAPQEDGQDAPE